MQHASCRYRNAVATKQFKIAAVVVIVGSVVFACFYYYLVYVTCRRWQRVAHLRTLVLHLCNSSDLELGNYNDQMWNALKMLAKSCDVSVAASVA